MDNWGVFPGSGLELWFNSKASDVGHVGSSLGRKAAESVCESRRLAEGQAQHRASDQSWSHPLLARSQVSAACPLGLGLSGEM